MLSTFYAIRSYTVNLQCATTVLQANKAAAQQAADVSAAGKAQEHVAAVGETSKGQEEAAQQQEPIKEAAQAAADSHPQPAEHQKAAEPATGLSAIDNDAQFSAPNGDAAAQPAAESQPKVGMPASSLLSSSDPAGAAKAAPPVSHLPWQRSQARLCSDWLMCPMGLVPAWWHSPEESETLTHMPLAPSPLPPLVLIPYCSS